MNILFIGPYRQYDGWGIASRAYLKSLSMTGFNISARPIYPAAAHKGDYTDQWITKLENNQFKKYDAVIQNSLPNHFSYDAEFGKNIGLFFTETKNLDYTYWVECANLMDELWVPSDSEKINLENSGATTKIITIPIPFEKNESIKVADPPSGLDENQFIFYYIGELVERKNVGALIKAYLLEFRKEEKVQLLVKTHRNGSDYTQVLNEFNSMCEETRGALRLYPNSYDYPEIQTITEFITEEQLYGIHKACDCFITTSRGESWCQPAIEAMSFGNKVIATDGTGTTFFLNKSNGWRIDSVAEPVICYNPPMNNIYNARENWMEPLTNSIREKMRAAFDEGKGKSKECTETVKRFSYKKVAKSMVDTI